MSWTTVDSGVTFPGNVASGEAVVRNDFAGVVTARYVRIHPVDWEGHISMRAGVFVEACGAAAAAAASTAAALLCGAVRESYSEAAFSSKAASGSHHPELDNKLNRPCWAAATKDLNQVSPRTLPPLLQ